MLSWVVKDLKFDFGDTIEPSIKWGDADAIKSLHQKAAAASDKLKTWLQQHLPTYNTLQQQILDAQAAIKEAKKKLKQALYCK